MASQGPKLAWTATDPDPLASLRIAPVVVDLGNRTFVIPALPAAAWLEPLLAERFDLEAVFPGLCSAEDSLAVYQMMIDGEVTDDDLRNAFEAAIEVASGRRWWVTVRLCASIRLTWEWLGGELARSGLTPFNVPLAWWLDGAYFILVEGLVKASVEDGGQAASDWNHQLTLPPTGVARAEFDEVANEQAFMAAMRANR